MANIITKRVIVEAHEASFHDKADHTLGYQVDKLIGEAIEKGYVLTSVEVHIDDAEWEAVLKHFHMGPGKLSTENGNRKVARPAVARAGHNNPPHGE